MRGLRFTALACAIVCGAGAAGAQERPPSEHPVHWSARIIQPLHGRADTVRLRLAATIDEFFHLYSTTQGPGGPVRTTVALIGARGWTLVALAVPAPDTIPDGNFGIMSEVYDDSVAFRVTLVASSAPSPVATIGVRYQACTARYCLPPRTDTLMLALDDARTTVAPVALAASAEPMIEAAPSVTAYGGADSRGAFLLLAASMGALALLTPCVFPMVPITITSFLATDDRTRAVRRAAQYAGGIVASFTLLGLVASMVFGATGLARFTASPTVNLAIAALFIVFALSLLGVIDISLPAAIGRRLSNARERGGGWGTVTLGALFTLTTFTCTAPFVGTLLVMSALGDWRWPLAGMLVFSAVFSAPFFLLALVPALLRRRPRNGGWLPSLETAVAFIELAAAVKFASNADLVLGWGLFTRPVVLAIWLGIAIALVITLCVQTRLRASALRFAVMVPVVVAAATLVPGLFGRRLGELEAFLPPMSGARVASASGSEPAWMLNDMRGALALAARENRPIIIDFTGYTCTNCRWMEANMFPRDTIKHALDRFIRVRLFTDGLGEPYLSQQRLEQRLFRTVALPFYAVLDMRGRPRTTFLGMTRDEHEFAAFLARSAEAH